VSIELDLELEGDLHGAAAPVPPAEPTGLWWRAGSTDTRAVDLVHVRFGFVPATWLHFRLGPGDVGPQLDEMATIVAAALAAAEGDALLHADFEEVWLLRRGGELVVSDDEGRWPAGRLEGFPPFTRGRLDGPP
jgi:hypothetical protein